MNMDVLDQQKAVRKAGNRQDVPVIRRWIPLCSQRLHRLCWSYGINFLVMASKAAAGTKEYVELLEKTNMQVPFLRLGLVYCL